MRDDDDDDILDDDEPMGRLYQSGIQREHEVEPAEYALTSDQAALEDRSDLLEAEAKSPEPGERSSGQLDRRRILALAIGGAALGTGAFALGSFLDGTRSPPEPEPIADRISKEDIELIDMARGWVDKPIKVLVDSSVTFLWTFRRAEPDARMRKGLRRLCDYALTERNEKSYKVAVRVLAMFDEVGAPRGFEHYVPKLGEVVWRWQVTQESQRKNR